MPPANLLIDPDRGKRIHELVYAGMRREGLTRQDKWAKAHKIGPRSLSTWMAGGPMSDGNLALLENAFGVSAQYIVTGQDEPGRLPIDARFNEQEELLAAVHSTLRGLAEETSALVEQVSALVRKAEAAPLAPPEAPRRSRRSRRSGEPTDPSPSPPEDA
jgi:hypothetical protein